MGPPVVRPYRDADRAAVIEALVGIQEYERVLHDTRLPGRQVAAPYFARLRRTIGRRSGAIFVAEAYGFAGFVACFVAEEDELGETPDSNRFGYVSDLFVTPDRRGRGIARALLAAAERHLATTGVSRVRVGVLAANVPARCAYERSGFEPYEAVYEKRLSASAGSGRGASA